MRKWLTFKLRQKNAILYLLGQKEGLATIVPTHPWICICMS